MNVSTFARNARTRSALALAIALATLNNFTWNRLWTWADRVKTLEAGEVQPVSLRLLGMEFGQYVTASAFGSGLQYVLTLLLSATNSFASDLNGLIEGDAEREAWICFCAERLTVALAARVPCPS